MPRPCSICQHSQRQLIDLRLASGDALAAIAREFPPVGTDALRRHREQGHISAQLIDAQRALEVTQADRLLSQLEQLLRRLDDAISETHRERQWKTMATLIREARATTETLLRVSGDLQDSAQVNFALTTSSEWIVLRASLLSVLRKHPHVLEEVRDALSGQAGNPELIEC